MTSIVQTLQIVCGFVWFAEAALLAPGTWRVFRKTGDALDAGRVPIFTVALVQVAFSARWLIWHRSIVGMTQGELVFWSTLYFLSAATAIFCMVAHFPVNRRLR